MVIREVIAVVLATGVMFAVVAGVLAGGRPEALPYSGGTEWGAFPLEP